MPIINKIKTQETIESRKNSLTDQVYTRLEDNLKDIGIQECYRLLKSYPFSATSGSLGPKLREGDKQIPEGIYKIEYLNPNSSFYLSLKIGYPNVYEKQKAEEEHRTDIGSDIFIHGKNITVGCIPIGDVAIEEVFLMASQVDPEDIEVIISPRDFRINPIYPEIDHVPWSDELYDIIKEKLTEYPNQSK